MRRFLTVLASAVALVVAVLLPAPATFAANPYTPQEVCGSAYTQALGSFVISDVATTYVRRNPSNGWKCVVTIKTRHIGTPTWVGAAIGKYHSDQASQVDQGKFSYYAGPAKTGHTCVWAAGHNSPPSPIFGPDSAWTVKWPFPSTCS